MIVKDVKLTRKNGKTTLSALCKLRKFGWDKAYFRVDSDKESYIYNDASPFAVALLPAAMKQGEDVVIHGSISQHLYEGMQKAVQEMVTTWGQDDALDGSSLQKIRIMPDSITKDIAKPLKTASFFTGGVDSFYTYLKHKEGIGADMIDSFVYVTGFDVHPSDTALMELTLRNVQAIAEAEKIELVVVESNLHELFEELLPWAEFMHGSCLAGVGLFLRKNYRQFYIPSSFTYEQQEYFTEKGFASGSTLAIDKLWSSEHTAFLEDGGEATRLEKILWQVSKSAVALRYLKVCYINKEGKYNCGTCDKCIRTMVSLYVAGVLHKSQTFPHHIYPDRIANLSPAPLTLLFHQENLQALQKRNLNPELQRAIKSIIDNSLLPTKPSKIKAFKKWAIHKPAGKLSYIDYAYNHSRGLHILRNCLYGPHFYQ